MEIPQSNQGFDNTYSNNAANYNTNSGYNNNNGSSNANYAPMPNVNYSQGSTQPVTHYQSPNTANANPNNNSNYPQTSTQTYTDPGNATTGGATSPVPAQGSSPTTNSFGDNKPEDEGFNIYITGLDTNWTKTQLDQLFSPFGTVVQSKILINFITNLSTGAALVRYDNKESAEKAINTLSGKALPGQPLPLMVRWADSADEKAKRKAKFAQRMSQYGMRPMPYGRPPFAKGAAPYAGRGAYPYADPYAAAAAYAQYPATAAAYSTAAGAYAGYTGSNYSTAGYDPSGAMQASGHAAVYATNLPPNSTDTTLYTLFGSYGAIASVKCMQGYGFINFVNWNDAATAINSLNGYKMGDGKPLGVSFKTQKAGGGAGRGGGGAVAGGNDGSSSTSRPRQQLYPQ